MNEDLTNKTFENTVGAGTFRVLGPAVVAGYVNIVLETDEGEPQIGLLQPASIVRRRLDIDAQLLAIDAQLNGKG